MGRLEGYVAPGMVLIADEPSSYGDQVGLAELRLVNHNEAYQTKDGVNINAIEGFIARVKRACVGVHHRFSAKYVDWYMARLAWKEDTRYMGVAWQFCDILQTVTPDGRFHMALGKNRFNSMSPPLWCTHLSAASALTWLRSLGHQTNFEIANFKIYKTYIKY